MNGTQAKSIVRVMSAVAIASVVFYAPLAQAAPINYGDFAGSSVMYLDVTETANTPGDVAPLYGPPSIIGDTLDFDPAGFAAASTGGGADLTDGQLNFTLMTVLDSVIDALTLRESGDYSVLGVGTDATAINYGVSLATVTALEVDGVALPSPIVLSAASASGGDDLSGGVDAGTPWSLSLMYDVDAALGAAGVDFVFGATKLEIAINDTLFAASEATTGSLVTKKDFSIEALTTIVPEPSTLALVMLGLFGVGAARRRQATS